MDLVIDLFFEFFRPVFISSIERTPLLSLSNSLKRSFRPSISCSDS